MLRPVLSRHLATVVLCGVGVAYNLVVLFPGPPGCKVNLTNVAPSS
jgi:hypothetical protein